MGPDLEIKGRPEIVMEVSAGKENDRVMGGLEDKHMNCVSNYEDNTFGMEDSLVEREAHTNEEVEVNIMDCSNSGDNGLVEAACQDASENTSSFGDTDSGIENGAILGDAEVQSELCDDVTSAVPFDGFGDVFQMRKKKLTSHWRAFVRPLMWRCKWVELQLKKFQSQAIKYDRELAENNQRKQYGSENLKLEGFAAKLLPFPSNSQRGKVMKRRKRKRVENLMDTTTYMATHNLFSYHENKKSTADVASMDDDWGNLVISADKKTNWKDEDGVNDELLSIELTERDNSLEQILRKIGVVQSQVGKLKTKLNKVMSENAGRFSSTDESSLLVPCNAFTSSARSPASPPINGDRMPFGSSYIASQPICEYNVGDVVMPESAVSSHGEVTHIPDITESTDQRLPCKSSGDEILIYHRRAKKELNNFAEVKVHPIEKPQVAKLPKEEQQSTIPPVMVLEDQPADDQPTPKIRSLSKLTAPKIKRKRGTRKAGKWSRRSSV
ncbi:unnamed protein product [Ilex paraguariensis]|uniref:Uncharacterized protein n=1 Tax=Ilex paraguariensis TaxID=185542 RepID=A0ABC8V4Q7_9AQUA